MNELMTHVLYLIFAALATDPPKWDPTYNVKGVLYIPYAEIAEPFEAWLDKASGRSRIDYYGGTVKTYQLSREFEYGTSLKIAPVSTDDELNKITCLQVNGTEDQTVDIQSILPDVKEFQLAGTEDKLGLKCDKFVFEETIGQKHNKYTLWVRYKKSPKYPASRMPIPVRYEMNGFNSLLGSHYDHYYLDYDTYSHEEIPNDIFEVDLGMRTSFNARVSLIFNQFVFDFLFHCDRQTMCWFPWTRQWPPRHLQSNERIHPSDRSQSH